MIFTYTPEERAQLEAIDREELAAREKLGEIWNKYEVHSEESEHLGIRWIAEYENKNWNRQTKMNIICEYGHYYHMSIDQALKDLRIDSPAGKGE